MYSVEFIPLVMNVLSCNKSTLALGERILARMNTTDADVIAFLR